MPSLFEYFKLNRYQAKYRIGDRVRGKWNKIPFVGTILNDNFVNEIEGEKTSVYLDLPIKFKGEYHNIIYVKNKDISQLK